MSVRNILLEILSFLFLDDVNESVQLLVGEVPRIVLDEGSHGLLDRVVEVGLHELSDRGAHSLLMRDFRVIDIFQAFLHML